MLQDQALFRKLSIAPKRDTPMKQYTEPPYLLDQLVAKSSSGDRSTRPAFIGTFHDFQIPGILQGRLKLVSAELLFPIFYMLITGLAFRARSLEVVDS